MLILRMTPLFSDWDLGLLVDCLFVKLSFQLSLYVWRHNLAAGYAK